MIIHSPSLLLLLSLFVFTLSINASQKKKRDISDMKDDSLLSKVFANDIREKEDTKERKDRSINLQDEQETNIKPGQQTAALYANYYNSLFATQETVPVAAAVERRAVDPAQEAMVAYATNPYFIGQAAKRNFIARPGQEQLQADANSQMKKSEIPSVPLPQDSFPLKLSLRSPNSKLQGAVPHFEEYGETVESVTKAQKRFKIPKPDYSSVIVKKDEIPHPDDVDSDNTNVNSKAKSSKRSKIPFNKNNDSKKRQYIQYPQMQQQFALNNGYAANYMNGANYFNAQPMGGAIQFQQTSPMAVATSHVQNLDGAISRPIVTEKVCDDQFNLCSEYAKNEYCTNYRAQMEVQCRKSCGFCAPTASVSKAADDDDDGTSGSGESGSGENEPSKKKTITAKASRRHDILQERAHVPKSDLESSGEGSGSGSGSGDSSGSGSGASESAFEPSKRTVKEHSREETGSVGPALNENAPEQEFHIPTKKDETPSNSDDESGSGSGSGSGDSEDKPVVVKIAKKPPKKPTKIKTNKRKSHKPNRQQKRTRIPRPEQPVYYPRIDLKEIASSLAHYEEAALELAGEYPNIQDTDTTEYTRSFIPHPESSDELRANRNRQNIQIAKIITSERAKKDNIPKFLKITSDVKKPEKEESEADSLDSVQRRFSVPGVEPTLNDYYAETGKLNPFDRKVNKNSKKSNIENPFKIHNNYDPYEYLRNMPAGASMEPIIDPRKRSSIPSDHSYPVFLMKVSPSDEKKYVEENADRRGRIRHFNAEGIEINEQKYQQMLRGGHPEMEEAIRRQQIADRKVAVAAATQSRVAYNAAKRTQAQFPFQPFSQPSLAQAQQNLQQQASLFPNNQQLSYEQQPGASSLRGKMLNAFFDTRVNSAPDEGSAMGSGDSTPIPGQETLVSPFQPKEQTLVSPFNSKVVNLQSLLSNPGEVKERKAAIPTSSTSTLDTNNYLRSNLAELSPENTQYNNYQQQSSLTAGFGGSQFTYNTMPKTQETNWIRPNAQSELASAFWFPQPTPEGNAQETRSQVPTAPTRDAQRKSFVSEMALKEPDNAAYNAQKQLKNFIQGASVSPTQGQMRSKILMPTMFNGDNTESMVNFRSQDGGQELNYLNPESTLVNQLSMTTAESKKKPMYENEIVKKNLIKESPDLDCGSDWKGAEGDFGTFCYKNTNLKANFKAASEHCKKLDGNLFSVLNAYENLYLQNHILSDTVDSQSWIGYQDKGETGYWNWTDGSRSIYTNWGKDIDSTNNRHDCVYIDKDEGKWRDTNCTIEKPFLCKSKAEACPTTWESLKLMSVVGCYKLFKDETTWEKAEQQCKADNAHLVSVTSEDEQTMIYQRHSSASFWIGFNDRENEGDWMWSDRSTSSFTNWADDAPNNGGFNCASVGKSGKWHDEKCGTKLNVVCKKKGPKPEKTDGYNENGILLPVSRLLDNDETAPSHAYDDLEKDASSPVVPLNFWPLLKNSKLGMAGNHPLAVNEPQNVKIIPGGVKLDGQRSFLDAGDFHGRCIGDPDKCNKGFSVALQVKFDPVVMTYKQAHYVIDTSGGGRGFGIYIKDGKLNYKVVSDSGSWELQTDLTISRWQEIVLTWRNPNGIHVYVNGAFKDFTSNVQSVDIKSKMVTTTKMLIGRQSKDEHTPCTKMTVGSVALFFKQLSVEDVPYAFTYGDTVVAYTRFLMTDIEFSEIPGAAEFNEKGITNIDGGIFVDGDTSDTSKPRAYLQLEDFPDIIYNVEKAKHGFAISFKIKFDQRVREYKVPKYVLDTGGHVGGMRGVSVYLVNDNMYFQVIRSTDEDIMIWKVRVPIYTVRWQEVVMTWRLDKGLWIYLDGMFRGHTLSPSSLPKDDKSTPKRLTIGRRNSGPDRSGAVFGFSSLSIFGRYLSRTATEKVFGNTDNPFQGIIREVWKNTPGKELSKLEENPDFPNNPTTIEIIEHFDAPFNVESNYGSKLKGYFIAPETGNNTFYLSCSRACALYISKDEAGNSTKKIIALDKPTDHNIWNKYDEQSSDEIFLVAGKYYYLEAIQKGVDNSDSLSVGVKLPTGRYQRPINKENLQWRLPGNPHAGLVREVWYNIPGYSVEDLTSNSNFPNRPSSTEVLDKFDAPFNYEDNYGSKISGYFHAPESGYYFFYMATDSSGELWLSTNENSDSLTKIISLNGWTDHNQWTKYTDQKSEKVFLVAGRYYYIRLYMKADKLGDCASVAVELPSGSFEGPIKKKHLSWRLVGSMDGPGPKEVVEAMPKPMGIFHLNENTLKDMVTNNIKLSDAEITSGPRDKPKSAVQLTGKQSSFVEIKNDGKLDARKSITILANIYPTSSNGPIVAYGASGDGVHLWQYEKSQLFVRFMTRDSNGNKTLQPLATRVLQLNKWNQVGASYDSNTGVAQLWHDGKMVKSRNIGQVDLATDESIRLGAVEDDKRYFEGKISCVQIYDRALKEKEIGELRVCPKSQGGTTKEKQANTTVTEMTENRIGDETEEELVGTRCEPNPCSNNAKCQDDEKKIDGFVCLCPEQFTGRRCQVSKEDAENPIVKRTQIPTQSNNTGANVVQNTTSATNSATENSTKPDESKEDVSLLYQKLGCFKDDATNHDLKTKVDLKKATQEDCAKACALEDKTFSYFALQNGTSCYCGKDHGKYGKLSDEACNIKCNGNEAESCGGLESNNVFFYGLGTNYTVKTFTGDSQEAGTNAKIYFELIGERGSSDFRQLNPSASKFNPGSVDTQTFLLPDLGKLKRMKILHDNTGDAPSWYLQKVQVSDEEGGTYEFPCEEWLSDSKGGGKLERELIARSNIPNVS